MEIIVILLIIMGAGLIIKGFKKTTETVAPTSFPTQSMTDQLLDQWAQAPYKIEPYDPPERAYPFSHPRLSKKKTSSKKPRAKKKSKTNKNRLSEVTLKEKS